MAKKVEVGERMILVKTESEEFRIGIPADAKITFGPSFPPMKNERGYGKPMEYALRIYRGSKDNLIAVFTGVREFREDGMTVEKKIHSEAGKTLWRSDEEGFKVATSVKRKEKFMDVKQIEGELKPEDDPAF
jgi:hypothetical protein